jgi:hypothetical protein
VREEKRIPIAVEEREPQQTPAPLHRITRLVSLALWFDELLRTGEVETYADLARVGSVSRARVTQIMDLLTLPPALLEAALGPGGAGMSERGLRERAGCAIWSEPPESDESPE